MGKRRDGGASATWEREVLIIFCDLCVREVELGNRPTTFFNKEGWENILKNFIERSGREYSKVQLKNKWDQLKKDWKLWKKLKSTGLDWDPKKKTIDASDEWWKEKLQVMPNAKKFRYAGIDAEVEEKLDLMFGGVIATCDNLWTPSQNINEESQDHGKSQQRKCSNDVPDDSTNSLEEHVDSSHSKRASSSLPREFKKKKGDATFLRNQILELVEACTSMRAVRSTTPVAPSISEAIKALDQMDKVFDDKPLYLHSVKILQDIEHREIFLAMKPERRILYLRHCFETRDT